MEIGLALSGGGIRAAVFHLGVLRRLADEDLLGRIAQLSTVSGGSLAIAALLAKSHMRWPNSDDYRTHVYPQLRTLLTTTDLLSLRAVGWVGLLHFNRRLITHRARVLAELLETRWGVTGAIMDLPDRPSWLVNTTNIVTGKNWTFAKREMGDWQFGRHYDPPFRLAEAAAASAAVPYVIGALELQVPVDGWYRTDPATRRPIERSPPPRTSVRLWDGGAYENLGVENLFKPQQGLQGCDFLICSDASGPLPAASRSSPLGLLRGHLVAPRLFDVAGDQIRALRTRMVMDAIVNKRIKGAFLRMGNSVRDTDIKAGRARSPETYDQFQADRDVALALRHPTDLRAISTTQFDGIARHGYEVADAVLTAHSPDQFPQAFAWKNG